MGVIPPIDYEGLLRNLTGSDRGDSYGSMRPGDLVLVTQRRTGIREIMVSIDPCLLPGRVYAGPCTYSVFLNREGKLEKILNELHIYSVIQEVPSGPEVV